MGKYDVSKLDKLADAFEEGDHEQRQKLLGEVRKLRNAAWCIALMLTFIAFLILRLG